MTLPTVLQLLALLYVILLAAAAIQDVLKLRISNIFSVAVLLVGAAALILDPGPHWWQHLLSFAIVLGFGILLFSMGWLGGGDSKLMAAAALAFDLAGLVRYLPLVLGIGGLLALMFMAGRLFGRTLIDRSRRSGIPYGVAIAIGAILGKVLFPDSTAFAP